MQFVDKFNVVTKFVLLTILIAGLGLTAFGQKQKSKGDLLKEISALTKTNTPDDLGKAFEVGKEYVARFGSEKDETTAKIKKFVEDYRLESFFKAVDSKKTADAFALGKEILAGQPENASVVMNLAFAGYNAFSGGDSSYAASIASYSDQAVSLIDAGKGPQNFAPFGSKDETLAWMNYMNATAQQTSNPKSAASHMWKAMKFESNIKSAVEPIYFIASYYEQMYEKMLADLNERVKAGTLAGDAEKAERARVDKCIDLMLDAYARTVVTAEAAKDPKLADISTRFAQIYKFRKGTDLLMTQFKDLTKSSPMPDPANFN